MDEARKDIETKLLGKIDAAVANDKPFEAEQWSQAYVQFAQGVAIMRASEESDA